ncbi:MAG TPA: PEP-utilizing enzyme [Acidimicrobiales bacterium]|nr:PEP-utilizing enzyme [Acidimicrobiales bacterium]
MTDGIWVVDTDPSDEYPIYTRGNIGEVFPEVIAPLSWTLGVVPGAEPGWRDALVEYGAFDPEEYGDEAAVFIGCFGGYGYLNVSLYRVLAVRTPGLTPELMDQALFGTSDAPPYRARPDDEDPAKTARVEQMIGKILTTEDLPELRDDLAEVERIVAERPDMTTLSSEQLLARARENMGVFRRLFARHLLMSTAVTVPIGIIQGVCNEIGDPTLPMTLVAGLGGVDSAAPSWAMWDLGRLVASTPALSSEFDKGVDGLLDRLRGTAEAGDFLAAFDRFLVDFGSRGPNEWEMRAPTWGTHPELALAAIDRMRLSPDSAAPERHNHERAEERHALVAAIGEKLAGAPEVQGQFLAACRAAAVYLPGRERSKTTIIKLVHEARLLFTELGRRMVEAGWFTKVEDFGMLTDQEWDEFLVTPEKFVDAIRERDALHERLQGLEPPFIVDGKVPPIEEWRPRGSAAVAVAGAGDVLAGIPGCPGQYTGRARVVLDPEDPTALEPGDILVAPITDPAWTPLFVAAGAVVVDVGAQISHAVIVARELGIPCVVSVTEGTRRIPDGATITVDGTTGTVTVL